MSPALRAGIEHEKRFVVPESKTVPALPPGLAVTVKARLVEMEGRRLRFEVEAHDGIDLISRGTHERCVIDGPKFDKKIKAKLAA